MKPEQSSYSAMCNIAESIPSQESIPPIPGTPELDQNWIHVIPESILPIPGIPELAQTWIHVIPESIPPVPGIPELGRARIPSDSGISYRNRVEWRGMIDKSLSKIL